MSQHRYEMVCAWSTALAPLQIPFAVLVSAALYSGVKNGPLWLTIAISVGAAVVGTAFLVAYFYFMRKNPDALRSERYSQHDAPGVRP